jgi:twitching motility protein PilJ
VDLPEIPRLLETVDTLRDAIRADVERILASRDLILESYELASDLHGVLDELAAGSGRLAEQLAETDAAPRLLLQGALQVARAEEMKYALGVSGRLEPEVGAADQGPVAAADAFGAALEQLRSTPSFPDGLRAELARLSALFRRSRDDMEQLVLHRVEMQPAVAAAESTSQGADRLDHVFDEVVLGLRSSEGWSGLVGLRSGAESALLFTALALVCLGLLGLQQLVRSRLRARASSAQNLANRQAIDRLLQEMAGLADGDLTVEAKVTSDVTGAIADTVNYVVTALRELVATIKQTSARVDDAAQRTRDSAKQLAEGSDTQTRQIERATSAISSVTLSIESIARDAAESAAVANRAVDVAGRGAHAVRDTIGGMQEIRGRIHDTSRRIRRLGDSSQEIGDIVELIDDISDQTNILALNAAMQAAMAGEAGRGFAVVADEVQRLAERSGNATRQIDAIVRTIRRDTIEAVRSMETSIAGVDSGAKVAENAGNALREIENVSNYIADLTRRIADSAGHEAREAGKANETVRSVQAIVQENTRGTRSTAEAVEALALLAADLRHSVAGFKLPPQGD